MERTYLKELPNGQYRLLSNKEAAPHIKRGKLREKMMREVKELEKKIEAIKKDCDHPVCYDEAGGFMYDYRHCVVCGNTSLL